MIDPRVMSANPFTIVASAKINLFLEVFLKRPDGYHDIRSLMVPVSLHDVLTLETTDGPIETTVEGVDIPAEDAACLAGSQDNLATQAAAALKKATGYSGGARIRIAKSIPVGGGLGGGSADAVATLKGLNQLWQTGLGYPDLLELCCELGSDIPAMLPGRAVIAGGRGDQVEELAVDQRSGGQDWWLVIANPGFAVATRGVYTHYSSVLTSARGQFNCIVSALKEGDIELAAGNLFNSLEETVFVKYPLLAMIAEGLREAGALGVMLCGSGASVFGLASSKPKACAIQDTIRRTVGSWLWVRVARTLPDSVTVAHGPLEARV